MLTALTKQLLLIVFVQASLNNFEAYKPPRYPYIASGGSHCFTHVNSIESDGDTGLYFGGHMIASNGTCTSGYAQIPFVQRVNPASNRNDVIWTRYFEFEDSTGTVHRYFRTVNAVKLNKYDVTYVNSHGHANPDLTTGLWIYLSRADTNEKLDFILKLRLDTGKILNAFSSGFEYLKASPHSRDFVLAQLQSNQPEMYFLSEYQARLKVYGVSIEQKSRYEFGLYPDLASSDQSLYPALGFTALSAYKDKILVAGNTRSAIQTDLVFLLQGPSGLVWERYLRVDNIESFEGSTVDLLSRRYNDPRTFVKVDGTTVAYNTWHGVIFPRFSDMTVRNKKRLMLLTIYEDVEFSGCGRLVDFIRIDFGTNNYAKRYPISLIPEWKDTLVLRYAQDDLPQAAQQDQVAKQYLYKLTLMDEYITGPTCTGGSTVQASFSQPINFFKQNLNFATEQELPKDCVLSDHQCSFSEIVSRVGIGGDYATIASFADLQPSKSYDGFQRTQVQILKNAFNATNEKIPAKAVVHMDYVSDTSHHSKSIKTQHHPIKGLFTKVKYQTTPLWVTIDSETSASSALTPIIQWDRNSYISYDSNPKSQTVGHLIQDCSKPYDEIEELSDCARITTGRLSGNWKWPINYLTDSEEWLYFSVSNPLDDYKATSRIQVKYNNWDYKDGKRYFYHTHDSQTEHIDDWRPWLTGTELVGLSMQQHQNSGLLNMHLSQAQMDEVAQDWVFNSTACGGGSFQCTELLSNGEPVVRKVDLGGGANRIEIRVNKKMAFDTSNLNITHNYLSPTNLTIIVFEQDEACKGTVSSNSATLYLGPTRSSYLVTANKFKSLSGWNPKTYADCYTDFFVRLQQLDSAQNTGQNYLLSNEGDNLRIQHNPSLLSVEGRQYIRSYKIDVVKNHTNGTQQLMRTITATYKILYCDGSSLDSGHQIRLANPNLTGFTFPFDIKAKSKKQRDYYLMTILYEVYDPRNDTVVKASGSQCYLVDAVSPASDPSAWPGMSVSKYSGNMLQVFWVTHNIVHRFVKEVPFRVQTTYRTASLAIQSYVDAKVLYTDCDASPDDYIDLHFIKRNRVISHNQSIDISWDYYQGEFRLTDLLQISTSASSQKACLPQQVQLINEADNNIIKSHYMPSLFYNFSEVVFNRSDFPGDDVKVQLVFKVTASDGTDNSRITRIRFRDCRDSRVSVLPQQLMPYKSQRTIPTVSLWYAERIKPNHRRFQGRPDFVALFGPSGRSSGGLSVGTCSHSNPFHYQLWNTGTEWSFAPSDFLNPYLNQTAGCATCVSSFQTIQADKKLFIEHQCLDTYSYYEDLLILRPYTPNYRGNNFTTRVDPWNSYIPYFTVEYDATMFSKSDINFTSAEVGQAPQIMRVQKPCCGYRELGAELTLNWYFNRTVNYTSQDRVSITQDYKSAQVSLVVKFTEEIPPSDSHFGWCKYDQLRRNCQKWTQNWSKICKINEWCRLERYINNIQNPTRFMVRLNGMRTSKPVEIDLKRTKVKITQRTPFLTDAYSELDFNRQIGNGWLKITPTHGGTYDVVVKRRLLNTPETAELRDWRYNAMLNYRFHICHFQVPRLTSRLVVQKTLYLDRNEAQGSRNLTSYLFVEHYVRNFAIPVNDWEDCPIQFRLSSSQDRFKPLVFQKESLKDQNTKHRPDLISLDQDNLVITIAADSDEQTQPKAISFYLYCFYNDSRIDDGMGLPFELRFEFVGERKVALSKDKLKEVINFKPFFQEPQARLRHVFKEGESMQLKYLSKPIYDMDSNLRFTFSGNDRDLRKFASIGVLKGREEGAWHYYVEINGFRPESAGNYTLVVSVYDEESKVKGSLELQLGYQALAPNITEPTKNGTDNGTSTDETKDASNKRPNSRAGTKPDEKHHSEGGEADSFAFNPNEQDKEEKKPVYEPLTMKIGSMNRNGVLRLRFNQPTIVPEEVSAGKAGRLLSEVDLGDYFSVNMKSKTSIEQPEYNLKLVEWSPFFIDMRFQFENPSEISRGSQLDQIDLKIVAPEKFVSKLSQKPLEMKDGVQDDQLAISVPRQLKPGVDEEALAKAATSTTANLGFMLIVQLVIQPILKGGLDSLWSMFYTLQLIKVIPLYNIYIPATLQIYFEEIRSFLDFDKMSPDYLVSLAFPGQDVVMLVTGRNMTDEALQNPDSDVSPGLKAAGATNTSFASNMQIYLFALAIFALVLLVMLALTLIKKIKQEIKKLLSSQISGFFFNGLIASVQVAFIGICVLFTANFLTFEAKGDQSELIQGGILLLFCVCYPIYVACYICKRRKKLSTRWAKHRFGYLFFQLRLSRSSKAKFYHSFFLARRVLLCVLPIVAQETVWPYLAVLFMHQLYMILYAYILNMPHESPRLRTMEMINEYIFMVMLSEHLILTDVAFNCVKYGESKEASDLQESISDLILQTIAVLVVINMAVFFYNAIGDLVDQARNKCQKLSQSRAMDKFILSQKPDVNEARPVIQELAWSELVKASKEFKKRRDLNYQQCRVAEEIYDQIELRKQIVIARARTHVNIEHVDEFGHAYMDENLEKKKLKGLFKLSDKKEKAKGTRRVRSYTLGDRLAPIQETEEAKESDSDPETQTKKPQSKKKLIKRKASLPTPAVELTALQRIEAAMTEKRELEAKKAATRLEKKAKQLKQ